jgi:hypothetical protein
VSVSSYGSLASTMRASHGNVTGANGVSPLQRHVGPTPSRSKATVAVTVPSHATSPDDAMVRPESVPATGAPSLPSWTTNVS